MPQQHDTQVKCPVCKEGAIVAEVERVTNYSPSEIPIGPGSRNYYHNEVTSFHCNSCQVVFRHPPGKPEAASEIMQEILRQERAEEIDRFRV